MVMGESPGVLVRIYQKLWALSTVQCMSLILSHPSSYHYYSAAGLAGRVVRMRARIGRNMRAEDRSRRFRSVGSSLPDRRQSSEHDPHRLPAPKAGNPHGSGDPADK
jgi:hypothetical protein